MIKCNLREFAIYWRSFSFDEILALKHQATVHLSPAITTDVTNIIRLWDLYFNTQILSIICFCKTSSVKFFDLLTSPYRRNVTWNLCNLFDHSVCSAPDLPLDKWLSADQAFWVIPLQQPSQNGRKRRISSCGCVGWFEAWSWFWNQFCSCQKYYWIRPSKKFFVKYFCFWKVVRNPKKLS